MFEEVTYGMFLSITALAGMLALNPGTVDSNMDVESLHPASDQEVTVQQAAHTEFLIKAGNWWGRGSARK